MSGKNLGMDDGWRLIVPVSLKLLDYVETFENKLHGHIWKCLIESVGATKIAYETKEDDLGIAYFHSLCFKESVKLVS